MSKSLARAVGHSVLVAAGVLSFVACASSKGGPFVWADSLPASQTSNGYVISAGDVISISVYGNAGMSAQRVRVRSDGKVSVPLLNDVEAADRTPTELAADLEKRLRAAELVLNPHVTVQVDELRPINVAVLGAVSRPGNYALDPSSGMAEALATAGGLTEFAHKDRIFVLRRTPQPVRIRFTLASITSSTGRAALFRLRSGDVVVAE